MKKGMMAMMIVIVLSLALLCAVEPAVTKGIIKTQPTVIKAKDRFFDLAVDHFVINGQSFPFPNDFYQAKIINVKVGQTLNCGCFYKVKTITLGSITAVDASYWGYGYNYRIDGGLLFSDPPSHQEYTNIVKKTPKFTYADVQSWRNQYGANGKKEWDEGLIYTWTAKQEHVGKNIYLNFQVDSFTSIEETDEQNNGRSGGSGCVAKFIVTPLIKVPPKDMSLEKNK